jgi:GNAT superfamily N-acetyltransferase
MASLGGSIFGAMLPRRSCSRSCRALGRLARCFGARFRFDGCGARTVAGAIGGATGRRGLELGQDSGGYEQLIGLGVELIGIGQDVLLEQLEDDQLDLDLHTQAAPGLQEIVTQHDRAKRIGGIVQAARQQHVQARGQLAQGKAVAAQHLADHGVQRHRAFQLVVGHQSQLVIAQRGRRTGFGRVVLTHAHEAFVEFLEKAALNALALEAQVAHGFEEGVLIDVVQRPIGHFEKGIVGVVEQHLKGLLELQRGLVAHLQQDDRQAHTGRLAGRIDGRLVQ